MHVLLVCAIVIGALMIVSTGLLFFLARDYLRASKKPVDPDVDELALPPEFEAERSG